MVTKTVSGKEQLKPVIDTEPRGLGRHSELTSLREKDRIPVVVYGLGKEPVCLSIDARQYEKRAMHTHSEHSILELKIGEHEEPVVIKEVQINPVKNRIIHIDFHRISLQKKIELDVPVVLVGEATGAKQGGTVQHQLRKLKVRGLPDKIPHEVQIDISALQIGEGISAGQVVLPGGLELLTPAEELVVHVLHPTKVKEVAPEAEVAEAEAGPEEPEVITKGKKKEEEAEAEAETGAVSEQKGAKPESGQPAGGKSDSGKGK